MLVDPSKTNPVQMYHHMIGSIVPRPIAWVSTISPEGAPNLAPFSFFTGISVAPPTMCFSPLNKRDGSKKDTLLNLESTPEFVINVVPDRLGDAMNESAADLDYGESEFERAGMTPAPSQRVRPPSVAESPIHFECKIYDILEIGSGPMAAHLVIGEVVLMVIEDSVLDDRGRISAEKLGLIGRMGGNAYARTTDLFDIERPQ